MPAIIVLFFLLISGWASQASPLSCAEIYEKEFDIQDPYHAYAVGATNAQGVRRIHVIDFWEPTLKLNVSRDWVLDVVLKREQFNHPNLKVEDLTSLYDLFVPRYPIQSKVEFEQKSGALLVRNIQRELDGGGLYNFKTRISNQNRFAYAPQNSKTFLFLVEVKTPDEIVELVFTKAYAGHLHEPQAVGYAYHLAKKLGYFPESIYAVRIYGGGFR